MMHHSDISEKIWRVYLYDDTSVLPEKSRFWTKDVSSHKSRNPNWTR